MIERNNCNRCNNCNYECDNIYSICEKIDLIQKRAVREELQEGCDRNLLLSLEEQKEEANTRPIMLFTSEDKPWYCPIDRDQDGCIEQINESTCVFRIEKVECGTVVLRALRKRYNGPDDCNERYSNKRYKSTNSFITIKLANVAAIRCLPDEFIDLCIH